jgi:hypothetical protein
LGGGERNNKEKLKFGYKKCPEIRPKRFFWHPHLFIFCLFLNKRVDLVNYLHPCHIGPHPKFRYRSAFGIHPPKGQLICLKIIPLDSAYVRTMLKRFQAPIYKNVEFCIFSPEERSRMRVFFFCFFFQV